MSTMIDTLNSEKLGAAFKAAPLRKAAGSALDALKPALGMTLPLLRRFGWRFVAFAVVAGAAAYLARSVKATDDKARQDRGAPKRTKPPAPELNRWENEGGMVATSAPSAKLRSGARGEAGANADDPSLAHNSGFPIR